MNGRNKSKVRPAMRLKVYTRDNFQCVTCGSGEDLTLDHKMPRHYGGLNTLDNLQTMCKACNISKGNNRKLHFTGSQSQVFTRAKHQSII